MPVATTTEAGRAVASNARANKLARAREAADTTTPLETPIEETVTFTRGPARRPAPIVSDPCLQWSTGLPTADKRLYAGWLVEAGKHADLDDAMALTSFTPVAIKHGSGNVVTHWALPEASLFVVADGIQSMAEMRDTPDRYGVAFGWRVVEGRLQSVLRCRVFVQELLAVGYVSPLLLSVKSTLTGDLLNALMRHYQVLDSINPIRERAGKAPIAVPYYAVSVQLGAGAEVARGSGQTREIAPMVEVGARDKAYITAHWCKKAWVEAIEAMADDTITWSRAQSIRIASGETNEEAE